MKIQTGTVVFPGKLWENVGSQYPPKVQAKLAPEGVSTDKEDRHKHVNVNARPDTPKAKHLLGLRRGQKVKYVYHDKGDMSYYELIEEESPVEQMMNGADTVPQDYTERGKENAKLIASIFNFVKEHANTQDDQVISSLACTAFIQATKR